MKTLIVRTGAMGDVLHALHAAAALRATRHDADIEWVVAPRWLPLLQNQTGHAPIVHTVHLADTKLWSRRPFSLTTLRSILALRKALNATDYDDVIDMQGTLRSAVIARFGSTEVTGFEDPRERLAARLYTQRVPRTGTHVIQQYTALLSAPMHAGLTPHIPELPHEPASDDWAAARTANTRPVLLAPGAGWAAKQWPAERFAALAIALRDRGFIPHINASSRDAELPNRVSALSKGAAQLAVCDVAGLIALTRRCALVVAGDSGPLHLAAALRIPLIALFGPTDPARNGPWSPHTQHVVLRDPASVTSYRHTNTPHPGLANISVAQVLAAIDSLAL